VHARLQATLKETLAGLPDGSGAGMERHD